MRLRPSWPLPLTSITLIDFQLSAPTWRLEYLAIACALLLDSAHAPETDMQLGSECFRIAGVHAGDTFSITKPLRGTAGSRLMSMRRS